MDVVVVCTANRARSPLAEALLSRRLAGHPVRVRSRGTFEVGAAPALPEMVAVARELGVDLSAHRARTMAAGELAGVDLVVGFEPSHVAAAVVDGGADRATVFTLPELVSLFPEAVDGEVDLVARVVSRIKAADARRRPGDALRAPSIDDPLGGSRRTFERVAREIAAGVDQLVSTLFATSVPLVQP